MPAAEDAPVGTWRWRPADDRLLLAADLRTLIGLSFPASTSARAVWTSGVHPEDRDRLLADLDACAGGARDTWESTYRFRQPEGTYRWVLVRGASREPPGGHGREWTGTCVDVHGLKIAEAQARERASYGAFAADVAMALTEGGPLRDRLVRCARAMVEHLDAALARIWTVSADEAVLELQASAGPATPRDGAYNSIPIGRYRTGRVAETREPLVTNDLEQHSTDHDRTWRQGQGIVSYAGYPLLADDRLVGVMAMFARRPLSAETERSLAGVARAVALGIEREHLEQSRQRLATILEMTTDLVTIARPDGTPIFLNGAAREVLGIGADEPVPSLLEFRPSGYGTFLTSVILPRAAREGAWRGETEYVTRRGRVIPVSQVTVVHLGSDGEVEAVTSISRDISEQREIADTLRDAEERTRFALEAARAGVWEADLVTGRVTWSDSIRFVHGISVDEFSGTLQGFLELVHPEDRDRIRQYLRHGTEAVRQFDLQFRSVWPDGSVHWVEARGRLTRDATGRPVRILGVAQDVTERKQLEEQLQRAQKIEAVGQLAGGLAHDFNNLLTVVLAYSGSLIEQLAADQPARADAEQIQKAGERAAQLTRQLLAFSHKQILRPVILDVNDLVTETTRMLDRLIGEHIGLELKLQPDLDRVQADPGQIELILVNLVVNARDAMPDGGTLTIETAGVELDAEYGRSHLDVEPGRYVMLRVSDTGMGMDEATRRRIFEPFFTTKERGKGTGLGLATVFDIARQTGGAISVYSEPGLGATFRVYLPAVAATRPVAAAAPAAGAPSGTETILLAEDETAVRLLVEKILARRGYRVLPAANPAEALQIASAERGSIDLLVSDVVMPLMSGADLYMKLREARPELRVLFMSGFADDAIARHGVLASGAPFIQKPFTGPALAQKVRESIDQRPAR
jgi:PAS domain S-box-containing protein